MKKFWIPVSIGVISIIVPLGWWLCWAVPEGVSDRDVEVLGTSIKNVSGLYAVEAALMAAYIAWKTNESRAEEAVKADYRDRIKWAVENFYSNNFYISEYAVSTIETFNTEAERLPISTADKNFLTGSEYQIDIRRKYLNNIYKILGDKSDKFDSYFEIFSSNGFSMNYWSPKLKEIHEKLSYNTPGVDGDISQQKIYEFIKNYDEFFSIADAEMKRFKKSHPDH